MEKISQNHSSRFSTRKDKDLTSSSLIDPDLIERVLVDNSDVIQDGWERRHGKLIYQKGVGHYELLAHKARKYGKPPKGSPRQLMAYFVNKEVDKDV